MRHNDILDTLQNLTRMKPTQQTIADILGVKLGTIGARALRNSQYSIEEIQKISAFYKIDLIGAVRPQNVQNYLIEKPIEIPERIITNIADSTCPYRMEHNCPCHEQVEIKYIECFPDEAKLPEITSIHVDVELVENHWHRKCENLRIIPMQGDCMVGYKYPFYNRDVLLIDIVSNMPSREGIYAYSANGNKLFYVAKLNQSMNGNIKITKYEENGDEVEKTITPEKQKEVDFRVLGRVVKNCSWSL